MTEKQKQHVDDLAYGFSTLMKLKYERGVQEHGGNVWDKTSLDLVEEAISENIDQFVYLYTLREKLLGQK